MDDSVKPVIPLTNGAISEMLSRTLALRAKCVAAVCCAYFQKLHCAVVRMTRTMGALFFFTSEFYWLTERVVTD